MAGTTYPEAPFSFTHKSGKGYDATMLTIRGLTHEDFTANAEAVFGADLWEDMIEAHLFVPQDAVASSPAPQPTQAAAGAPKPAQAPAGSGDWKAQAPDCVHGRMEPREWTGKSGPNAGKPQYTYFCPQPREVPREQKCSPVDAITGKSWGA